MKCLTVVSVLVLFAAIPGLGESLWTEDFPGYLAEGVTLAEGDTVQVQFGGGFSLSYESASEEDKRLTLEFSGGPYGDLFSFLPQARSKGDRSLAGGMEWTVGGSLAARVAGVDSGGMVTIEGNRTVSFDGREELLSVSGSFNMRDLSAERTVAFGSLVDARVVFRSIAEPGGDVLSPEDVEEIVRSLQVETIAVAAEETAGEPREAAAYEAAALVGSTATQAARYRIPEERKKELFLRYVNRIVDILF